MVLGTANYVQAIRGAQARNCFITIYAFDPRFAKRKNYQLAIIDALFFEFDCAFNLMLAAVDARKLVSTLQKFRCRPRIYFSGGKGFHILPDFPEVKLDHPRETLKRFGEGLIQKLDLRTADLRVIGDLARLSRIPGTLNTGACKRWGEPLWCAPLSREELFSFRNELDIIAIARKPPVEREIHIEPSPRLANHLLELDEIVYEEIREARLITELEGFLWENRPHRSDRKDGVVDRLIARAELFQDGRKRVLTFLIIPHLVREGLSDLEILRRCRDFVEGSRRSWIGYRNHVLANLKRTRTGDWAPWRVSTFIEKQLTSEERPRFEYWFKQAGVLR